MKVDVKKLESLFLWVLWCFFICLLLVNNLVLWFCVCCVWCFGLVCVFFCSYWWWWCVLVKDCLGKVVYVLVLVVVFVGWYWLLVVCILGNWFWLNGSFWWFIFLFLGWNKFGGIVRLGICLDCLDCCGVFVVGWLVWFWFFCWLKWYFYVGWWYCCSFWIFWFYLVLVGVRFWLVWFVV